jgi:signal transduction histidine kinase
VGAGGTGRQREHAWVTLMPWWHVGFAIVLVATGAFAAVELGGSWRLPCVLALYGALGLLYILTPHKFSGCNRRGAVVYLYGAFALFTAASFVFPGTGFLMFVLIPQCFMLLAIRRAFVGVIGMTMVLAGANLAYSGVNAGTVASISLFGVFTIVLSSLFGGYVERIIDQSKKRADLIDELERTRAEVAGLSRETGILAERQRLAGEIHDALAQGFTSVILLLQAAQAALERGDVQSARGSLALAEPAARDGLDEARSLISALSPLPLQGASLVGAIERVCADVGPRFGFVANFEVDGEVRDLSNNAEIVLLRAAQEALANVGRHANATLASVRLTFGGTVTSLEVSDDGVGFDAAAPAGFGLSQLRSRVADLGGSAEVIAARGQGTTVRVLLPADGPDVPLTATNGAFSATGPEVP